MVSRRLSIVLTAVLTARWAGAQVTTSSAPQPTAVIRGFVYDSIHGNPLVGAVVLVDGAAGLGQTAPDGQFVVDSVPAGAHRVHVMHPMLDTLGLAMMTDELRLRGGDTANVRLFVPSGRQIITRICPAPQIARGPGALIGQVSDPDTDRPAAGSRVQLLYDTPNPLGFGKPTPTVREAVVDSAGSYKICGLPSPLTAKLQVFRNDVSSGQVEVKIDDGLLALRSLAVIGARQTKTITDSAGRNKQVSVGRARLTGKVINRAGTPVERARVGLEGSVNATLTNTRGEFALDSLPAGTQSVEVRKLGYGPTEKSVELSGSEPAKVTVIMSDVQLAPVIIEANREQALTDLGYTDRKHQGFGYFLDGSRINNNASQLAEIVRSAPSLRFNPDSRGRQVFQDSRDPNMGCVTFYVDGSPFRELEPGDINDYVAPNEVRAVEVYGSGSAPSRFVQSGRSTCAVVVIWTVRATNRASKKK
jgi:hypothetical protein